MMRDSAVFEALMEELNDTVQAYHEVKRQLDIDVFADRRLTALRTVLERLAASGNQEAIEAIAADDAVLAQYPD